MQNIKNAFELFETLLTGSKISVRVDCGNYETVHILRANNGAFDVLDRGETVSYLSPENADNYRTADETGRERIGLICEKHNVEFRDANADDPDSEPLHTIGCWSIGEGDIADAVQRISECIDEVFEAFNLH